MKRWKEAEPFWAGWVWEERELFKGWWVGKDKIGGIGYFTPCLLEAKIYRLLHLVKTAR